MKFALILFVIVVALQSTGQILERKGMMQIGQLGNMHMLFSLDNILRIATNPYVILGVACSAVGLFLWLGVLSNVNVSYIYPFGAISYILLAFMASMILGETITLTRWVGIFVIVIGAVLINR